MVKLGPGTCQNDDLRTRSTIRWSLAIRNTGESVVHGSWATRTQIRSRSVAKTSATRADTPLLRVRLALDGADLDAAVYAYNHSQSYVTEVLSLAETFSE